MSWRKVTLGDLVDSFSIRAKDVGGGSNLPFYGVSNEDGITKSKYAAEEKADDYKIIEKSCFAYNPYRINVGSIALMDSEETGLISPAYVVFKPKPRSIIPKLLLKFLKSNEGLRQIRQHARGTVRQALRFEDLCKIELLIPDYEQQELFYEKIANVEREAEVLSSELTHQLDLVKQLRQAFLREAMQGKLVNTPPASGGVSEGRGGSPTTPSAGHLPLSGEENASVLLKKIKAEKAQLIKEGKLKKEKELPPIKPEEIPFKIPKNWVWCRLGDITLYSEAGISFKALETIANRDEYGVIKTSAITSGEFIESENKKLPNPKGDYNDIQIHEGDLLICRASGSKGLAGKSCVVKFEPKTKLLLSDKSIRFVLTKFINVFYFQYFSRSMYAEEYFLGLGTKKSTTMNNITREQFYGMTVPLPPLSEQHRIVAKLEQLMRHCDELEQSIKTSQTQNEQLLQQVLREALSPKGKEYKMKDEMSLAAEE